MRCIVKGGEPEDLSAYRDEHPDSDWKKGFKSNAGKEPNLRVREALYNEQHGICVYCEIDLKKGDGLALDDFRVEHFYPENPQDSDKRNDGINYALFWPNLFGCCSGGNSKSVVDKAERYCNPDYHCDVPKGNNDWTGAILNPISDIPEGVNFFRFDEKGWIHVSTDKCPQHLLKKAENTISYLNLNSRKLLRFRESTIDTLRDMIKDEPEETLLLKMRELADSYLIPDSDNTLTPFCSTIQWYLSPAL